MGNPFFQLKPPVIKDTICRGSYKFGSACGRCRRCEEELATILDMLIDPDPCRYDHNGFCQTHYQSKPCGHEIAKQAMSTIRKRGTLA